MEIALLDDSAIQVEDTEESGGDEVTETVSRKELEPEPVEPLVWPAPPGRARVRYVGAVARPQDLGIRPSFWRRVGDFFIGDMIPTVISDDKEAAAAINRRTLTGYVQLPNYRNYWKAAGYVEEMEAIEAAIEAKDRDKLPSLMSDKWLSDVTLYGSATEVRDGVEAWFDAGVKTPILVPSAVKGGQMQAFQDIFAAFA